MDNGETSYRKYLDGDDDGLAEIIRDYKDGLILYLNGITGNISSAEEIMEETFFKLAIKKPVFRGKSSFKTWLYSIGRNAAIDALRKNRRMSELSVDDFADVADERSLETEYLKEEQKIMLHKALDDLNPDYRQVIYLTYFENFTIDETAIIMKKNKKQINNLLYRAKQSLRSKLEKGGFVYENL
ncbi:MAG: RNA polymerase sigma factor [Ruminococcus flavefaciens]|nr:RNA polymerase sigma factor [Ruminococcus flavefaciens]MCM1229623.1 RNA polymerase sigma factor [Ruminococcus flavefaciens]